MTELSEHTKTPWIQSGMTIMCEAPLRYIGSVSHPSSSRTDEDAANAAFIVKAVNAHQELVDTLRSALAILGHPDDAVSIAMREVLERLA